MIDTKRHDIAAELDMLLSSAEIQKTWDDEKNLSALPNVTFHVDGHRVTMHFDADNGRLPGIQGIKQLFTKALHKKGAFPACKIKWL